MINRQLIEDALTAIGVLGEGESANDSQAELGLRHLNELMAAMTEDGLDLQYFEQTDPEADCPIPAFAIQGIKAMLAISLAPDMGAPIPVGLADRAQSGRSTIVSHCVRRELKPVVPQVPRGAMYDIYSDG